MYLRSTLHAVQPQHLGIAAVVGLHLGDQGRGVVAAGLGEADAAAHGAHVLVLNPDAHGGQAALIVRAGGAEDDDEQVSLGGSHAQELVGGDHERADVQRRARLGGDPVLVHRHDGLDGLHEVLLGDLGDAQAVVGGVGSLGVHVRPEQEGLAVVAAIRLQALEHLLPVVEHHRRRGQRNILIRHDPGVMPALAFGVVHHKHVIGKDVPKAQLLARRRLGFRRGCFFNADVQHGYRSVSYSVI